MLTTGYKVADERGDKMPRDAMGKLLTDLGAPVPKAEAPAAEDDGGPGTGFRCERPGCASGKRARQLPAPAAARRDRRAHPPAGLRRLLERVVQGLQHQGDQRAAARPEFGVRPGRVRQVHAGVLRVRGQPAGHLSPGRVMTADGYLVQYGRSAYVGRFAVAGGLTTSRGDRVVVRTPRGVELGEVLCGADDRFAGGLDPAAGGELLRPAGPDDLADAEGRESVGLSLLRRGRGVRPAGRLPRRGSHARRLGGGPARPAVGAVRRRPAVGRPVGPVRPRGPAPRHLPHADRHRTRPRRPPPAASPTAAPGPAAAAPAAAVRPAAAPAGRSSPPTNSPRTSPTCGTRWRSSLSGEPL